MNTARQLMERRKSYGKVQRRAVSPAPQKQSSAKKPAKPAAKKPQPNANPSSQLKGGVNKKLKKSAATPEASSPKKPAHGPSSVVMQDGPESPPPLVERFSAEELLAAGDDFEDIEAMCKLESPQEGQKKANNNNSTPMSRPPPVAVDNSQAAAAQAAAVQAQAAAKRRPPPRRRRVRLSKRHRRRIIPSQRESQARRRASRSRLLRFLRLRPTR